MCICVRAVTHAGSRELHATHVKVRPLQTASTRHVYMHASASVHVNMCHELSHARDAHAKHVQVLSAERLLSESLPGALNGRADDGLGRRRQLAGGSCGPDD